MRVPRVYINIPHEDLSINDSLTLPKETANHIINVLKRRSGDNLIIFNSIVNTKDNTYGEYYTEILDCHKNKLTIKILDYKKISNQSNIQTELAQCVSKPHHFETTLQKSVELGVTTITPIISSRSEQKLNQSNIDKKMERWQKIIISATEQSGRADLPLLTQPISLDLWLKNLDTNNNNNQLLLSLCTKTNNSIKDLFEKKNNNYNKFSIIIGPEGGLDDLELQKLQDCNFEFVKLGKRILRTETASVVILSILQYQFGDFG